MYEPNRPEGFSDEPRLSLAMIILDSGQNLASLLAEAGAWTDEIVIGDAGRTHAWRETALEAGARILDLKWQHDFSAARNTVLAACRGQWILCLDVEEQLASRDWDALRHLVDSPNAHHQPQAVRLQTRNYIAGRYSRRGWTEVPADDPHRPAGGAPTPGFVPTSRIRLFPNRPEVEYRGRLHETVESSLKEACIPIVNLPWPVHHFGWLNDDGKNARFYRELARLKTTDNPHDATAWADLAECATACGDYQEALSAVDRALVLNPTDIERRLTAGWLLKQLGNLGPADLQLAAVAGGGYLTDAQLAETCHLRAEIAMLQGRAADASPLLALALRLFPENGFYLTTLGVWHLQMGRDEPARLALEKAAGLIPDSPEPLLQMGLMYESAGKQDLAIDHLRRALLLDETCTDAGLALKRLQPSRT